MIRRFVQEAALAAVVLFAATGAVAAADVDVEVTQERADGYRAEVVIHNPGPKRVTDWSLEFSVDRPIERVWGAEMTRSGDNRYRFRPDPWTREIVGDGQAKFTIAGPPSEKPLQPKDVALDAKYAAEQASAPPEPEEAKPEEAKPTPKPAKKEPEAGGKQKPTAQPASPPKPRPAASAARASGTDEHGASSASPVKHTVAFKLQSSWDSGFTAEMVVVNESGQTLKPWRLEFELQGDIIEMWNADFRKVGSGRYVVTPKSYNEEIDPNGFVTFGFKTSTAFNSRPDDSRLSALN